MGGKEGWPRSPGWQVLKVHIFREKADTSRQGTLMHQRKSYIFHCLIMFEIFPFKKKAMVCKRVYLETWSTGQSSTFYKHWVMVSYSTANCFQIWRDLTLLPESHISSMTVYILISLRLKSRRAHTKCQHNCWLPKCHYLMGFQSQQHDDNRNTNTEHNFTHEITKSLPSSDVSCSLYPFRGR